MAVGIDTDISASKIGTDIEVAGINQTLEDSVKLRQREGEGAERNKKD